jgi:hypothetical protein
MSAGDHVRDQRETFAENTTGVVFTAERASDPDANTTLTWSLSGADAGRFTINATTGAVRFVAAPDFENRADANADGIYDVVVTVSDGQLSDARACPSRSPMSTRRRAPAWATGGLIAENSANAR